MEKLKMQSPNMVDENIEKIGKLFPDCLTEVKDENGKTQQAIDFDKLRQELSKEIVEGSEERYQFTWPDKKKAILTANAPINKTLRPCREESVDFDNTQNLYIEGDNLDVLKLMREDYLGKVKMIYIDPPYNTGNDFVYEDDFAQRADDYINNSGQLDDEGNRLVQNTESNGRFHTDWLNMIYPRLRVARDFLTDDGAIFISINDSEIFNLKKICNEVYGELNFVADLIWANKEGGGSSDSKLFRIKHEHILCYAKNKSSVKIIGVPVGNEERYKSSDKYVSTRGKYYLQKLGMGTIQYSVSLDYPIVTPDGSIVMPADNNGGRKACWRWSKQKYEWGKENGFIEIKKDTSGVWTVYSKQYLNCDNEGNIIARTQRPMGIIDEYSSTKAAKLLENMGLGSVFSYAKPIELIRYLCERITNIGDIILDFFSGSATTAHAVMQLNAEDGGNRKFVMVQLPEITYDGKKEKYNDKDGNEKEKYIIDKNTGYPIIEKDSEARKAGYWTIVDIGKERIRRAGKKILEEQKEKNNNLFAEEGKKLDIGFRVLKLDSSNMEDVYYTPKEFSEKTLFSDNIKADRTSEDLLFQVLPECNLPLSCKIEEKEIVGKKVFIVNDGYLIACFDKNIDETVITEIAKMKPYYFVMRDSSMKTDNVADNFDQIFNLYSKETIRKIL